VDWRYHPAEQNTITTQRPADLQTAVGKFMEAMGDPLVEIGLGKRLQPNAPPMGGLVSAIESAVSQAFIWVLANEDPGYVRRHLLTEGTAAEGLLVATLSPQEQAKLAQEALRAEDPRR
jgi:hypothetical protein